MMRCDRLHATIRVEQCLRNQGLSGRYNWSLGYEDPYQIPTCKGCETGRLARDGKLGDRDVENLIRDEAGKIIASIKNKGARVVESGHEAMMELEQETRTCTKCGKTWPITDFYLKRSEGAVRRNQCKRCDKEALADWNRRKKERKASRAKEEAEAMEGTGGTMLVQTGGNGATHKNEEHAQRTQPPAREPIASPHMLTIDFSKYPELMEEIKLIAEHEERTPEGQVRYWLRKHLGSAKRGEQYGE